LPLFHKLFLSGVEKFGGTEAIAQDQAGDWDCHPKKSPLKGGPSS
jgi:hypothetical protein